MTGNKVVLGLQWGDEGKGKVIDLLSGRTDLVVRCQGGANAGHTVVVDGRKTILHLLPSGALHPGALCVIGNGVVVDPVTLCAELAELMAGGVDLRPRLRVSDRAHLVLPVHKHLDGVRETLRGDGKVGTTLRGIGPCYADKARRSGLRCGDLVDLDHFKELVDDLVEATNRELAHLDGSLMDAAQVWAEIEPACRELAPLVADTVGLLHEAVIAGKTLLFEGAQGTMLDIDFGSYPYVTSSNTGIGGIITGSGLGCGAIGEVIGIVKAYTTRVGEGPMLVELSEDGGGRALRERGGEYGATTGRPRRCGWLDLVVVDYACKVNGVDTIALTKLDVLSDLASIPVCVAYEGNGERITTMPARLADLETMTPVYEHLSGWNCDISDVSRYEDLPTAAQAYVHFIENAVGVKIGYIGTGPDREATIVR